MKKKGKGSAVVFGVFAAILLTIGTGGIIRYNALLVQADAFGTACKDIGKNPCVILPESDR